VLRTEVFQYLIDTRATGCITQLLREHMVSQGASSSLNRGFGTILVLLYHTLPRLYMSQCSVSLRSLIWCFMLHVGLSILHIRHIESERYMHEGRDGQVTYHEGEAERL
jgi:hypothetical protein